MNAIWTFPFVDPQRLVIGGQSRGGILSVAYAGLYPDHACGVINDGDPFYPLSHSQANFAAFLAAGGNGSLHILQPPEANGHHLVAYPEIWKPTVLTYLQRVGMAINRT